MKFRLNSALSRPLLSPISSSILPTTSRLTSRAQVQLLQSRIQNSSRSLILHKRTLIAAPNATAGPLLSRRPDRELPEIQSPLRKWLVTLPVFLVLCTLSALGIFNYEKSSSSVVAATLYSLRTHPRARELLGDEIYFRDRWPWIWGELNMVHGRIDIGYGVKGTKGRGYMRFRADRPTRTGFFETRRWSLEMEGEDRAGGKGEGEVLQLLEAGGDPFAKEVQEADK